MAKVKMKRVAMRECDVIHVKDIVNRESFGTKKVYVLKINLCEKIS